MAGNPMQDLLRRQLGIDAFALDGDAEPQPDDWTDKPANAHSNEPVRLAPVDRRWSLVDAPKRN